MAKSDWTYDAIVAQVQELIDSGAELFWQCPWKMHGVGQPVSDNGRAYTGGNAMALGMAAQLAGEVPVFGTANTVKRHGGWVKAKEDRRDQRRPYVAYFWAFPEKEDKVTGIKRTVPFLKVYNVFGWWDCEWPNGLPKAVSDKLDRQGEGLPEATVAEANLSAILDNYMATGPKLFHGGDQAYYRPSNDTIQMPQVEQFNSRASYLAVLAHESGHSTGSKDRLNRDTLAQASYFGDENYSREELVAELTSAFLVAETGVKYEIERSAGYLKSWTSKLREDPKMLVKASGQADKAAKWIKGEGNDKSDEAST